MALNCATKEDFMRAKSEYEFFVSKEGLLIEGGADYMNKYLALLVIFHTKKYRYVYS